MIINIETIYTNNYKEYIDNIEKLLKIILQYFLIVI